MILAPGTEDPTHTGCHFQKVTSTRPALAKLNSGISDDRSSNVVGNGQVAPDLSIPVQA